MGHESLLPVGLIFFSPEPCQEALACQQPSWELQLAKTRARGAPVRSLLAAVVLNVVLTLAAPSVIAVMAIGNLGYLLSHIVALAGAALATPALTIGIRRLAGFLAIADVGITGVGASSFRTTGYGGFRELAMAASVLLVGLVITYSAELTARHGISLKHGSSHSEAASTAADQDVNPSRRNPGSTTHWREKLRRPQRGADGGVRPPANPRCSRGTE
jgi:hypothetical protein